MRRGARLTLCAAISAGLLATGTGTAGAVTLIDSDLEFMLRQIQIAEQHAGGAPLLHPDRVPDATLPFGLRTVGGTFNNLQPGQTGFGAADRVFPRITAPQFRTAEGWPAIGLAGSSYTQKSGSVADSQPRTISNLIVDASPANPAAAQAAADTAGNLPTPSERLGGPDGQVGDLIGTPTIDEGADDVFFIPNTAPDEGLSAPYNSWFTLFGQFFDHGLDLVTKGRAGTVFVPLQDDDPLIAGPDGTVGTDDDLPPQLRFMTLTRATNQPGPDGVSGDVLPTAVAGTLCTAPNTPAGCDESADDIQDHSNTTTPFVDQNQTYTSHPAHQAFLREYELRGGTPFATGNFTDTLFSGEPGLATWATIKAEANAKLGIRLSDVDVLNVPLIATDDYGRFLPAAAGIGDGNGATGFAQLVFPGNTVQAGHPDFGGTGEGRPTAGAVGTGHAFLDDIAHHAAPRGDHDANPATPAQNLAADSQGARLAKVVNKSITGGIATLTTQAPHGLSTGDQVKVLLLPFDPEFDGLRTVTVVDPTTITFPSPGSPDEAGSTSGVIGDPTDSTADDGHPGTYDNELLDRHFITGDGRGNENIGLTSVHHVFHSEHNRLAAHIERVVLQTAAERSDPAFLNDWLATPFGGALPALADVDTDAEADSFIAGNGLVYNGERVFQAARFGTEMQYQHLVFEEFARKIQPEVNVFTGYDTAIDPAITAEFAHTVYRFGHSMLTESVDRTAADGSSRDLGLIEAFLNPEAYNDSGTATPLTPGAAAGQVVRGMTAQVGNELDEFVTDAVRNNLLGLPLDLAAINMARGRDTGIPPLNAARRQFHELTGHPALVPYTSWSDFEVNLKHAGSLVNFIAAYGQHPSITAAGTLVDKRAAATLIVAGGAGAPADRVDFLESTGAWAPVSTPSGPQQITGLDDVDFWVGGLAEKTEPFGGLLGSTFNFVFETQMEALQDGDRFYYLSRNVGLNFLTELEANSFGELVLKNTDIDENGVHLPHDVFSTPNYIFEMSAQPGGPIVDDPGTPYDETTLPSGTLSRLGNGTVRFVGGEHIVMGGTAANDKMQAGDGDDSLWGDGGNDDLLGGAGNDAIVGGDGDDVITDTFGIDTFKGGRGNDAINAGPGTGDLILSGSGSDFVNAGPDVKETFADDGNDFVIAGDAESTVFGNEGADWIEGGNGADLLQGGNGDRELDSDPAGHDVIIGDAGNDDYDAESGDDIMVAGPGIERNEGVFGYDWVTYERDPQAANADLTLAGIPLPPDLDNIRDRFDVVEGLSGGQFNDVLRGDSRTATELTVPNPANPAESDVLTAANIGLVEGLQAELGAATFNSGNIILGGAGSDVIEGRGGNDHINGDKELKVEIVRVGAGGVVLEHQPSMAAYNTRIFNRTVNPGDLRIRRFVASPTPGPGDADTAVFAGIRADYTVDVQSVTRTVVTDNNAADGDDGTDVLVNMEFAQFSDQTTTIGNAPGANPTTGTVDIGGLPAVEDGTLSAIRNFDDVDGIVTASIQYSWEKLVGIDWTPIGAGTTFTVGDPEVGFQLRVTATYTDNDTTLHSLSSTPTAVVQGVNDPPTGTVTIDDATPTEGDLLTSANTVADADGLGVLSFQWLRGAGQTVIGGATGSTYTPVQADVGQVLRVRVSYLDGQGTTETVTSAPTGGTGDLFTGTAAANVFNGTAFDDRANGLGGADTLNGNAGADILNGGLGNDAANGNGGNDTIEFAPGDNGFDAVAGNGGTDRIVATGPGTVIGLSSLATVEEVSGGVFPNVSILLSTGNNTVTFAAVDVNGVSFIDANDGNDTVTGSAAGNDLRGGAGTDTLNGLGGTDVLTGGGGNDTMNGGGADDVFRFGAAVFGADVINGFDAAPGGGQDLLDISAYGITAGTFAARVNIVNVAGNARIRIDGPGVATRQITLNGVAAGAVSATDFILAP